MTQHWVAVAPGDRVAYYSPTEIYGNKDQFQSFTAVGPRIPIMPPIHAERCLASTPVRKPRSLAPSPDAIGDQSLRISRSSWPRRS